MTAADAFVKFGAAQNWPPYNKPPLMGIGFTLGAGSWPEWDGSATSSRLRLWRNPAVWDEPARYGTVTAWKVPHYSDPLQQFYAAVYAARTPALIPWGPGFSGAGGTQPQSADNGCIVRVTADGARRFEMQGLAPVNDLDVFAINARGFGGDERRARIGDWRCDAVTEIAPGVTVHGSQGPLSKAQGLLRPQDLAGPWTEAKRLVGFNVQWGIGAKAAPGGRVEHPRHQQPYGAPIVLPEGDDPNMMPSFTPLLFDITDGDIERWLADEKVDLNSMLAVSKRWFAIGLRDHGLRLAESGTGNPIIESNGGVNPTTAKQWAARGVISEQVANDIGRGLFRYGTWRVTA